MKRRLSLIVLVSASMPLLASGVYRYSPAQEFNAKQTAPVTDEISQRSTRFPSPYDIERYINQHDDEANLNEIWDRFGIPTEQGKPGRCGCRSYDCPGNCRAEIINASVNGSNARYVILRICYAGETDCWFLAFKKEQQWKYVWIIESLNNQYEPPQHRIEKYQSEQWLVIKELWGRGTGFLQYGERWFGLSDAGLREALSYPVSGYSVQGDAEDYEFKAKVSNQSDQRGFAIDARYTVFTESHHSAEMRWLSSRKHELRFAWDAAAKRFVLDESKSKLPKSGTDPIFKYLAEHRFVK